MSNISEKIEQSNHEKRKYIQALSDEELQKLLISSGNNSLDLTAMAQEEWSKRFPPIESPTPTQPIQYINTKSGCFKGCLIVACLVLAPYLLNASFITGNSLFNQIKWQQHGSTSYKATVGMSGLVPFAGESVITTHDGAVISGQHPGFEDNQYLDGYGELTIERMFADTFSCSLYFPLLTCSIEYDPYYGYPTTFIINCPIPDACYSGRYVKDVVLLKP